MRKVQTIAAAAAALVGLLFPLTVFVEGQQARPVAAHNEPLPRDLEIELALSALPPHLRDNATVYVLKPDRGFEVARTGTNGFHTFVARNDPGAFRGSWPYTAYREDILVPISFDRADAKENMRVFFDVAEMQAEGIPPGKLKRIINQRYETGHYRAPERVGISYMMSPVLRAYSNPDQNDEVMTFNVPHYMFYAPNISNEDIGGRFQSAYPFVLNQNPNPHGYIIQVVGQAEVAAINKEYKELLAHLCEIKAAYCLSKQTGMTVPDEMPAEP